MKDIQFIYLSIDDSGKLTNKEKITVYGGIIFINKKEKDKFITQYKAILSLFKCKYCHKYECNKKCPELKCSNLEKKHLRRLLNYIKKYYTFAVVIKNNMIYESILNNKSSKGRYLDYSVKLLIKKVIIDLIDNNKINNQLSTKLIINIDEQTTKSNGYYNLKDSLYEELKNGIINYNYSLKFKPLFYSNLEIHLKYQHSDNCFTVQAADLIAGSTRRNILLKKDNILKYYLFLP